MINNKELLFVVDENNQPQQPLPRNVVHKNSLWHRTAAVWVINRNGKILCQKRSLKKDVKPGMWEAFMWVQKPWDEEVLDWLATLS